MKGSTRETDIIYVALPMDGGDPVSAPAIFLPTAVPVGDLEAGQDDAQERRHQSHSSMALVRAGLILLVGFLVTSFILFGATRGLEGHHRSHRHSSHMHAGCFRGHRPQGMGVQVDEHIEEGNIEVENYREYKMDGWYAGNESHDGWHASTADDEVAADAVAVENVESG